MKITICKEKSIKLFAPGFDPIRLVIPEFWAKSIFEAFEVWVVFSSVRTISNCPSQVGFVIKKITAAKNTCNDC